MDDYEKKLKELRTYVPFLTKMIDKLEKAGDKSKQAQLSKMKSLKGILTAPDKKLKLDTLIQCENVLQKLYEKVEGAPLITVNNQSNAQGRKASRSPQRDKPRDKPREKPQAQQSSLSSYLQQIHDSQHLQQQQLQPQSHLQPRFNQGKIKYLTLKRINRFYN